jgi:inner membrane protein
MAMERVENGRGSNAMPTTLTHALVGLGLAEVFAAQPMPWSFYGLSAALSLAPDLDVVAFRFGIPYGSRFGHRGFSHSLCCAALLSLLVAALGHAYFGVAWQPLALFAWSVVVIHSLLDAMTNGGMGIAFFAPLDNTRYFLPWRPVQVSPIGLGVFSRWGLRALLSEVVWIWFPLAALLAVVLLVRMQL